MLQIVKEEEKEEYIDMMDKIAATTHKASKNGVKEMYSEMKAGNIREATVVIGIAAGQIVLEDVIVLTKDMSKEKLVRWFAEASAQMLISAMVHSSEYRVHIERKFNL